ncbi:hypothetical protein BDV12DRAFT_119340 [Aspergillus spectabilis]
MKAGDKTDALSCLVQGLITRCLRLDTSRSLLCAGDRERRYLRDNQHGSKVRKKTHRLGRGVYPTSFRTGEKRSEDFATRTVRREMQITLPNTIDRARALHEWGRVSRSQNIDRAIEDVEKAIELATSTKSETDELLFWHSLAVFRGHRFTHKEDAEEYPEISDYLTEAIQAITEAKGITLPTDNSWTFIIRRLSECLLFAKSARGISETLWRPLTLSGRGFPLSQTVILNTRDWFIAKLKNLKKMQGLRFPG